MSPTSPVSIFGERIFQKGRKRRIFHFVLLKPHRQVTLKKVPFFTLEDTAMCSKETQNSVNVMLKELSVKRTLSFVIDRMRLKKTYKKVH
jgi:hypothetical protein